ncbi:hypothetical protein B0H10DRAFT_1944796 [Mycena sp. CBHHK59/15]|nr:hypothetical protein B0H10DRAFT_1944796 [Mycena sp. CBHHK59/15]
MARDLQICLRQVEVGGREDGDATLGQEQHGSELWCTNSGTARSRVPQSKGCRAGQWRTQAAEKRVVVASSESHSAFRMVRAARSGVIGRNAENNNSKFMFNLKTKHDESAKGMGAGRGEAARTGVKGFERAEMRRFEALGAQTLADRQ